MHSYLVILALELTLMQRRMCRGLGECVDDLRALNKHLVRRVRVRVRVRLRVKG